MSLNPPDDPIVSRPDSVPSWCEVIDLAGVRVERGLPARRVAQCEHKRLTYCADERRVWCSDCERTIENFDAFMTLTTYFHRMAGAVARDMERAKEALAHAVLSRAAKALDKVWRGRSMAPCCPHCRGALLPEDFADGVGMSVNRELEEARRKRDGAPKGWRR